MRASAKNRFLGVERHLSRACADAGTSSGSFQSLRPFPLIPTSMDTPGAEAAATTPPKAMSATMAHGIAAIGPYELYMLILSTFAIAVLVADWILALSPATHNVLQTTDTLLCVLFFCDFIRNMIRAPSRRVYFVRAGWLDLLSSIPTIGALRLGRLVRIGRIVRLLRAMRSLRTISQVMLRRRAESALSAAALVSVVMTVFGSLAVLQFEQVPTSNIKTGSDALWWAFATITTVGYGDRYPVTLEGRLVAGLLMVAGVGLFGALSGLVASWFLHPEDRAQVDQLEALREEVARLAAAVEKSK